MRTGYFKLGMLGLLLLLALSSCGTGNVGVLDSADIDDDGRAGSGVSLANFEVIRYNTDGFPDAGLNNTLSLKLKPASGETGLVIAVADNSSSRTVALDVRYDATKLSPSRVEFHGLLGRPEQVLSASFLNQIPGVASVGETTIGDYLPGSVSGSFATVYFRTGPSREVMAAGDVHQYENGVNDTDVPSATAETKIPSFTVDADSVAQTIDVTWYGAWHRADGDQNSEVNIADLTPLGLLFGQSSSSNFAACRSDYNRNGLVEIADLTPIGFFFGQRTSEYTVSFSDDVDGAPLTAGGVVAWGAGESAGEWPGASVAGDLSTVFTTWNFAVSGASSPSFGQIQALDANTNGNVRVIVVPRTPTSPGETDGAAAFLDFALGGGPQDDQLFITDFDVVLEGVSGGSGASSDIFAAGDSGSVAANTGVNFRLNSISGTFNAAAFDSATFPTGMDQAMYDAAFDAASAALVWDLQHGGAAGFRRTSDWIVFDGGAAPITGDPGPGVVFPDDDPESDAANAEGIVAISLGATTGDGFPAPAGLDIKVLADIDGLIDVDVTEDANAATIGGYFSDPQTSLESLTLTTNTTVFCRVLWNTEGDAPPADLSATELEMFRMVPDPDNAGKLIPGGDPVAFEYSATGIDTGQFDIRQVINQETQLPEWFAVCVVPGLTVSAGSQYAFRLNNTAVWTSINKPTEMLGTQEPPAGQELINIPEQPNNNTDYLQIFYDDPVVRRNGKINVDILSQSADPEDQVAFDDMLKPNGEEFVIEVDGPQIFPTFIAQETDNQQNQDEITGPDDPDAAVGLFIVEFNQNRIVVDIAAITGGGQVGDPEKYFVFKLFSKLGLEYGYGDFIVQQIPFTLNDFTGINWGVDVFDRTPLDIEDRDFSNKFNVSKGTTGVDAPAPDVIWVEFAGGFYFDWDEAETNNNPVLYLDQTDGGEDFFTLSLKVAGITPNGAVLATHALVPEDFFEPGNPFSGLLRPGKIYNVGVDSPLKPGTLPDTLFPNQMNVLQ